MRTVSDGKTVFFTAFGDLVAYMSKRLLKLPSSAENDIFAIIMYGYS